MTITLEIHSGIVLARGGLSFARSLAVVRWNKFFRSCTGTNTSNDPVWSGEYDKL